MPKSKHTENEVELIDLLKIVDNVGNIEFKFDMFCRLILTTNETLLNQYYTQIQSLFSEILMAVMENEEVDKSKKFKDLLEAIQGTRLMEEKLSELISAIKHLRQSYPDEKSSAFFNLLHVIEKTDLIEKRFGELLAVVENTRGMYKKSNAFINLMHKIEAGQRDQLLDQYNTRIKVLFSKILIGIERLSREEIKRIVLSNMIPWIKKANLFNHFYPQIKIIISKMLSEFIRRSNGYQDYFIDMILMIKETNLITDNFSELLSAVEKISYGKIDKISEFSSFIDKIGVFSILLSSINETDLMEQFLSQIETAFSNLLNTIENISNNRYKRSAFGVLVVAIIETNLMDKFSSHIEAIFSNLLSEVEKLDDLNKFTGFYEIFSIRLPTLKFQNLRKFNNLLVAIKGTDLMKKIFPHVEILYSNVLNLVENMPESKKKRNALHHLAEMIKETELVNKFDSRIRK